MKKSELKELIRTSLLEEMEYDGPSTYTDKDLDDLLSIVLKYVEDPNDAEEEIVKFDTVGFDAMSDYVTANLLRDKDYNDWYNKLHSIKEAEEEKIASSPKPKKMRISPEAASLVNGFELEDLQWNLKQIYKEMEQEAELEGGPIADQYADIIDAHEQAIRFIKSQGSEIAQMTYDQAVGKIEEAEEEEEDVEVEDEVEVTDDEKEGIDVKQDADSDLTGVVGNVQDNLEAALEAARKLGDEKLVDQIGNTLTFFTRNHVVKENIEIPGATLTKVNQTVKDVSTMAQVMVDLYQQIQDKEQIDFTKNPKFNLALNKLKELIKTGSEEKPVKENIEIPNVERLYQDHEIEWIDKPFDYFGDGNVIKKGDKGRIIAPEVPKKGYYLIGMVGSKGKEVKFYSFLNKSFKLDEPLRDPTNEPADEDAEIGMKLDESIIRMKKLAGLIK
jgi:hypothetical protein